MWYNSIKTVTYVENTPKTNENPRIDKCRK